MVEEGEGEEELQIMWGTVSEICPTGNLWVEFDDGGKTYLPQFWARYWGHDPKTLTVGTRLRCAVAVVWTPNYTVRAVLTTVHEGKKKRKARG
jgi:hypothetical protein